MEANLANIIQTLLYALTTRLGAPGRDRYLLGPDPGDRLHRRLADGRHRRDRRRIPRPCGDPVRRVPGDRPHRPDDAEGPRGRGDRPTAAAAGRLARHRFTGVRHSASDEPGSRTAARSPSPSTSTFRSACRSARIATSWSSPASAARGPRNRIGEFLDALLVELDLRADALDAGVRWPGTRRRPPLGSVYLGGGTPSLLPDRRDRARSWVAFVERFGVADDAEITIEANPGPDERGDPAALRQRRRHAALVRGPVVRRHGAAQARAAPPRRRRRRTRSRRRATAGIASVNIDLLYDIPDSTLSTWMATLDAALELEPDHLSLYALTLDDPVAEGLTGPAGDHLPTTKGARRWRDDRPTRPGRGPGRRPVPPRRAVARRGRLPRLRDLELGEARSREPAQPRVLAAPAERGLGPGAHAFDGADAALDRRPPRLLRRGLGGLAAEPAARRCRATRRRDGDRRVADPGPAAGHGRAARPRPRAAARRRLRLGARGGAARPSPPTTGSS